jgi:hypothetical protein
MPTDPTAYHPFHSLRVDAVGGNFVVKLSASALQRNIHFS